MARYHIDDEWLAQLKKLTDLIEASGMVEGRGRCEIIAGELLCAGVALRAEVAREICGGIEKEIVAALESNYRAMRGHNLKRCPDSDGLFLERIYGKIDALRGIEGFVKELKKKHTECEK